MIQVNPKNMKDPGDKIVRGGILWNIYGLVSYPTNCTIANRAHLIARGKYSRLVGTRIIRSFK